MSRCNDTEQAGHSRWTDDLREHARGLFPYFTTMFSKRPGT